MSIISPIDNFFAKKIAPQGVLQQKKIASLLAASREGHICIPYDNCLDDSAFVGHNPQDAFPKHPLCVTEDLLYLQKNWVYETQLIVHVKRILHTLPKNISCKTACAGLLEKQKKAIDLVLQNSLTLITGGPGTGKSYLIVELVKNLSLCCKVLVVAPTGKAVAHIAERLEGIECNFSTLHALLPQHQERVIDADCIIVDECSMVDLCFFSRLCARIAEGTRLVLVGDKDQLPPVGSGSVFADLMSIQDIPSVRLDKCMRFEKNIVSHVVDIIQNGDSAHIVDKIEPFDLLSVLVSFYPQPSSIEPDVESACASLQKACILSCVRAGPMGVDTSNRIAVSFMQKAAGDALFWAAPIVIVRNSAPLYNGDTGMLVHKGALPLYAVFKTGVKSANRLPPFEYAYALSVHKSQGCEYDRVFLLLPPGSEVFGKEALYTAATRAKKHITLHGDVQALSQMLVTSSRRTSGIGVRWKNY